MIFENHNRNSLFYKNKIFYILNKKYRILKNKTSLYYFKL